MVALKVWPSHVISTPAHELTDVRGSPNAVAVPPLHAAGKDLTAAAKKQKAGSGAYFPISACQVRGRQTPGLRQLHT